MKRFTFFCAAALIVTACQAVQDFVGQPGAEPATPAASDVATANPDAEPANPETVALYENRLARIAERCDGRALDKDQAWECKIDLDRFLSDLASVKTLNSAEHAAIYGQWEALKARVQPPPDPAEENAALQWRAVGIEIGRAFTPSAFGSAAKAKPTKNKRKSAGQTRSRQTRSSACDYKPDRRCKSGMRSPCHGCL